MTSTHPKTRFLAPLVEDALSIGWLGYQDMIVCPYCLHQNFDDASQCEACHVPLPANTRCDHCGASVPAEASFCGQCGSKLGQRLSAGQAQSATPVSQEVEPEPGSSNLSIAPAEPLQLEPQLEPPTASSDTRVSLHTQLQWQPTASLLHIQSGQIIALPQSLSVIHIGKPNDQIPPDVDVAGFPHSEIVSRIHAAIRVEGESYFVEDLGSVNGTYVNYTVLPTGNRHRLQQGDRLALGKGDLVSFLFQLT